MHFIESIEGNEGRSFMAKKCITEKSARRQQWIENGLLELMITRRFDDLTVTDLCRYLELSRRSFYRYFRDLEDVLDSALDHIFQGMAIPNRIPELNEIQKNYEFWFENRHILDALHNSNMIDRLYDGITRYTVPMEIQNYLDSKNQELWQEASQFAIGGFVSLIIFWYKDGFRKSPEQMAQIAYRMLFSPILAKP